MNASKKAIESVIMIIPRRNKVKEARSMWSHILKLYEIGISKLIQSLFWGLIEPNN